MHHLHLLDVIVRADLVLIRAVHLLTRVCGHEVFQGGREKDVRVIVEGSRMVVMLKG